MSPKDLFRLPHGDYKIKKENTVYVLSKKFGWEGRELIYMLRECGRIDGGIIFFHEEEDYVFEQPSRNGYYKQKILVPSAIVSGIHIRGNKTDDSYPTLRGLSFVPKMNFKKWETEVLNQLK